MCSASLYLQLIEEWDCKPFRYDPSSLNKFVIGLEAGLWIRFLKLLEAILIFF